MTILHSSSVKHGSTPTHTSLILKFIEDQISDHIDEPWHQYWRHNDVISFKMVRPPYYNSKAYFYIIMVKMILQNGIISDPQNYDETNNSQNRIKTD